MDPTCSAPAAGLTVQVCFPGARAAVLDNLNRQREEGRLCDLSIQVQGHEFKAHRCVLAASSPYFHDQVLLKNVTTVSLPSVMDPVAFESVLSSAYTGQLSIVHDDIVNYVTVASFLQMWHIVDKCTEILKRSRPSSEVPHGETSSAPPGSASRQQSPSSSDCLYLEREGRRKERKPDALPPLATWRRPQEFQRWGRPRPSSAQHLAADSQLEALPCYAESDYTSCEDSWVSSQAKTSHYAHDGPGLNSRHHGMFPSGEALKQKARITQRGALPSADRLLVKNREVGDGDEAQERKKNEKREIEADEGVGEEAAEKKEGFAQMCGFHPIPNESVGQGQATGKTSVEEMKEKVQRNLVGSDPSSDLPGVHASCQTVDVAPGPSCPASARMAWQTGPSSEQQLRLQDGEAGSCSKDDEEEEEEEEEDDEAEEGGVQNCDGGNKLLKRRKRRKVQKWDGSRSRRLRLSSTTPSPVAMGETTTLVDPSQAASANSSHLLASAGSPNSPSASSVLKIKTEMSEPINFDNDSSIWNYPPNREISRNESPYSMTSKPAAPGSHDSFPSPQGGSLQVAIPDSVLTPPGTEGGAGGVRKPPYNGSSAPSSASSAASLAPPSSASSADPLSPPLSASPRDKQQGTPTTSSSSSSSSSSSASSSTSSSSLLYSGDLEALQRLQAGNVVLPLVHRVTGTLASTSTTAPRVYTTGTIRYAPADVTLAMAQGNLLPNAAMNFVDGSGFGLDPKTPMEMLYHHVHRLNMSAAAAAGPFVGSPAASGANGALGGQMPTAANVFTTAEGLFSTLPFPVYSNGIHTTQTTLERKED